MGFVTFCQKDFIGSKNHLNFDKEIDTIEYKGSIWRIRYITDDEKERKH